MDNLRTCLAQFSSSTALSHHLLSKTADSFWCRFTIPKFVEIHLVVLTVKHSDDQAYRNAYKGEGGGLGSISTEMEAVPDI
jgi:hypothetical protein